MKKSDWRRLLQDKLAVLEEPMRQMEGWIRDFWSHPEDSALAVWGYLPVLDDLPEPPPGTVSKRHLNQRLMTNLKPARRPK